MDCIMTTYYARNKEKIKQQYEKNKADPEKSEKMIAYSKKYYNEHKTELIKKMKERNKSKPPKPKVNRSEYVKKYYEDNKVRISAKNAKDYKKKKHPETQYFWTKPTFVIDFYN